MSVDFYAALKERRSIYGISKDSPVSSDKIVEIVQEAVKHSPSAFNSQSARVVVLFGDEHEKLWNITKETLKAIVPAENFSSTEDKLNSFQAGYGTVLFFEDNAVVSGLQEQFPLYQDNFPVWSLESSGMLQFVVWTALTAEGLGASLQHYNPLIDEQVKATWELPETWKLLAQMPFGKPTAAPGEKSFKPLAERVKVFG